MKRWHRFIPFVLLSATLACIQAAPKTPERRGLTLPTAFVVTAARFTPPPSTHEAVNPNLSAVAVLPVTTESEYRLRVEISTSSDWTNLEILNSEIVREAKITAAVGTFTNHTAAPDLIAMNQTLENAQAGKTITLGVDLSIQATANADELEMILKKGDIGLATLRFYRLSDAGEVLIQEITHDFPEGGPSGLNDLSFSIYFRGFP